MTPTFHAVLNFGPSERPSFFPWLLPYMEKITDSETPLTDFCRTVQLQTQPSRQTLRVTAAAASVVEYYFNMGYIRLCCGIFV